MSKLIKNWEELAQVPANDKYRIVVNGYCGWIVPITDEVSPDEDQDFICHCDNKMDIQEYYTHHRYLSTHTFYGLNYRHSTKMFQECGFDIEIDNWDKVK